MFFVDENSGDYFCSEECIQDFYGPVAAYYHQKFVSLRDPHDIPESDFERYEKYASLCLDKPKEVWIDESESGEQIHFFLSEFSDAGGIFWYVVMAFCLEGDPTFVLASLPTRDKTFVAAFRRGRQVDIRMEEVESKTPVEQGIDSSLSRPSVDERGIAVMEDMLKNRSRSDIKPGEFEEHSYLLDETIENPDEAWEMDTESDSLLTLITQHDDRLHYVVICALDKTDETQATWRVLYHFPTGDPGLVERYRRGLPRDAGPTTLSVVH